MLKHLLLIGMTICISYFSFSQERACATDQVHERLLKTDPQYARRQAEIEKLTRQFSENFETMRLSGDTVIIPCIVHVVYANSNENISDAQVQSQIDRLNKDFSATNSDYNNTPAEFAGVRSGDTFIRFELIETKRYANSRDTWGTNDLVKSTYPPIEPARILNMWVADIGGGILGYAQFPGGNPATDGVVMSPQYFGDATAPGGSNFFLSAPFDRGRTATHEVGHWLNLRHIWGDGNCNADDFVSDTPVAGNPNYGCPAAGTNSCPNNPGNDMFMNYMDYVDDACMFMFSAGQDNRMQATFANGGGREGFLLDPVYNPGGNPPDEFTCSGTVTSFPYNQSFESGIGNWTQDTSDDLNWTRQSGGTPSSSTGPSSANDGSFYMYIESSSPNYPSKVGRLESPCFDLTGETTATFSFDYHMYGSAMGSLAVQAITDGGDWTTIWSLSGNQGNSWASASINMSSYLGETVKLRFVGTTGSSYTSDISIDKISMTTAGTPGGLNCSSTETIGYSESFEGNFGGWTQVSGDDFDWTNQSGGTPSSNTGPSSAFAGSNYIYIEASNPNNPSKVAQIEGPCFDLSSASTAVFSFSYHMYGAASMGNLELQATTDGNTWSSIWSKSGNQGNNWLQAEVNLAAYLGDKVKLKFIGTTGDTWQSDIAIDALSLSSSTTTPPDTTTTVATLSITFDNYPEETRWEILDGSTIIASGGTYGSQPDGSTLTQNIELSNGCYDFVIYDSYGDGICCSYGNGSYSLTANGVTLASGGSFGSSETTNFCVGGSARTTKVSVSREGSSSNGFAVYPIPASERLKVYTGKMENPEFTIMTTTGQIWKQGVLNNTYNEINVSDLDAGLYILRVTDGENVLTNRILIK
ncbi:T9SS-dependent choice-of-anchor J family protein [Marinigracilibium pacificum]|uniref:T9SS type A sorting domain-containing protein n=1 Tax=Marinigracilibium pacificum TaxID=2729599 RepID=A0A848IXB6_9BACT|nr:choice-of-anchor J domain-containing protein [Marinigracilibium pacificum]NMM47808.1 T9SS type A sorting domain-containing protein [Marinigracilibium pacificum]